MLVRAARRKVHSEALRTRISSDSSHLPWTRAQGTAAGTQRWSSIDSGSQGAGVTRRRRNSQDASNQPARRSMATVVSYTYQPNPIEDIPFESGNIGGMPSYRSQSLARLTPSDTTSPIYLGGSLARPPVKHRMAKNIGINSSSTEELKSVFEACLQIGRIERAEVIFRRLLEIDTLNAGEVLVLHNRYLRASVDNIISHPSETATQRLHSWFELEMRVKDVHYDYETLAYMVKASLQAAPGQRERLVRRYMEMLDEQSALQLIVADVLTAQEINDIAHIYPKYHWAAQQITEVAPELSIDDVPVLSEGNNSFLPNGVPLVKATEQKGLGLESLKKSLSLFNQISEDRFDLSTATMEEKREIQSRLEQDAVDAALDRWKEESEHLSKMGVNPELQTKSLGARMWKWQVVLEKYLRDELALIEESEKATKKSSKDMARCEIGPFLRILPVDKLAATTILTIMRVMGANGVDKGITLSTAITNIAGTVEDESVFQILRKNIRNKTWPSKGSGMGEFTLTPEILLKATKARGPGSAAKLVQMYANTNSRKIQSQTAWSVTTKAKLGSYLMTALLETAKVPVTLTNQDTKEFVTQMQPAFSHSHKYKMGKRLGIILANKVLVQQLKSEPVHSVLAKQLPMLVEPEPWTHFDKGGFLLHPGSAMRIKNGDQDQKFYAEAASGQGDMKQTFKGLDILGKTAWRINQGVFDVMLQAWNSGEEFGTMPADNPKIDMPPEPADQHDSEARKKWMRAVKSTHNLKTSLHSQRCFQNFQMEIARALRNEVFYFPHNIDFRGRAYPIPPYLNHMGADHCRGLLRFGEGRALGGEGLRWIKIHVANVYGYDKASLSEREQFAMEHLEDIKDSATNSLSGRRWWLKAEDPWQCLAACMELNSALESADPSKYISHLPIHQDGTCNGLQHYAALGGDSWGAKQVNLEPGDRPADVYSAVAKLVIESIDKDRAAGDARAAILKDKVNRKTVKQTVMTNVYGVTYIGAKAQVRKQLVASLPDLKIDDEAGINYSTLSSYIATKIFTALSSMFRGAHDIQYWLGECAQRISTSVTHEQMGLLEAQWPSMMQMAKAAKSDLERFARSDLNEILQFKSSVIWTNPLHMPVVQPYRKQNSKCIKTNLQSITLMDPHRSDPVDKRKQLQGFPPNFIHSLDATHMLLSALRCDELGLSFAAVHDSFWTHPSDVPTMNGVLRDAFIQIHSEDVIGRLKAEFDARYNNSMYAAKIKNSSPAYKKIKTWRMQRKQAKLPRSKGIPKLDELILEHERLNLLRSSDPAEVKKGEAMITPGSIFASMAEEGDLALEDDLKNIGLGDMSARALKLAHDQEIVVGDPDNVEEIHNPLEGGEQLDPTLGAEEDFEASDPVDIAIDVEESSFERRITGVVKRKAPQDSMIWLPLTFPPIPKKGDFDVSRLKDSTYFFS